MVGPSVPDRRIAEELRVAVAEGLLDPPAAAQLAADALRLGRSPLELLHDRGVVSGATLASLASLASVGPDIADLLGGSQTAEDQVAAPRRDSAAEFPVANWDRYEPVRLLGQGAMGRVFLARDLRLRREVAIKFMRGDEPELARRLVSEARAQARVDHACVCKVYEVGEVDGKVYIAMQHIAGRPLGALRGELTVEQIALVVHGAALGVSEAHRVGLIHRDLKPSNIMVERGADGALRPYVMDFGLARDWRDSATLTGTVLGTPHYMAPEQARGEVARLDRRADVYSLGATLYALLAGRPPIPGAHPLEVLANVASFEPSPLRKIDRDLPADLDAIAMKCLDKDRSARYDSARALADDLARFLAGEPVLARAAGLGYRLRRRLRKHARRIAAIVLALAIVLTAVGYAAHARGQITRREELARRFTERVERIEALARYAALARQHDIRADRAKIRAAMDALDEDIRAAGAIAAGPGGYALGRGWLALGDDERAEHQLAAAWRAGFRSPRVAYALALATGHLYQQALHAAERLSAEPRAQRRHELERRYREPVLSYLRDSNGADVPSVDYVEALVALYEGRYPAALDRLDAIARAGAGLSWFYEAPLLRGEVLRARGALHWHANERAEAASDVDAARQAFTRAASLGESDPAVHEALGDLEEEALVRELYGSGAVDAPYARGIAAAERALAIDPDRYEALSLRARLHRKLAEERGNRGEDTTALLRQAIADAGRAVGLAPGRPEARLALAQSWRQWGEARQRRGEDPAEQLGQALAVADAIAPADRDDEYHVLRGLAFKVWADHEDRVGRDSGPHRSQAIEAYLRALAVNDQLSYVWFNLGVNYHDRAKQPRNLDVDGDIARAIAAFDRGRALDPRNIVAYFYGGRLHMLGALRRRDAGSEAGPELALALARYREGLDVDPRRPQLHSGIGSVLAEQARDAWDHGADPFPLLDAARTAYEHAAAVAPQLGLGTNNLGWLLAVRAAYQRARGDDPTASVGAAAAVLREATARAANQAFPWASLADAMTTLAAYELAHGRDPSANLAQARAAIDRALAVAPDQAYLQDGEARAIEASWHAQQGRAATGDFAAADHAYTLAVAAAPLTLEVRLRYAAFCRTWADWLQRSGQDPSPAERHGLTLIDEILGHRAAWPDALVVRASLVLGQARRAADPARRAELAHRAAEDFAHALAVNPNLELTWRSAAQDAASLGGGP